MSAKVERLVNLTVALLEARRPMTLEQVRRRLRGYDQEDRETARRMFERDKDDLRRLGIPVRTVALDAWETEWGYTIDRKEYALPPVDLAADELAALAIALQVTGAESARLGLAKLAVRAPDAADTGVAPPARVELPDADLDPIGEALLDRRAVTFRYRTAEGEEAARTVDPYGLVLRRGVWYLVGRDHDRDAIRVFRLDRCLTRPRPTGEGAAYQIPTGIDLVGFAAGPVSATIDAVVGVAAEVAWEGERRGARRERTRRDGWVVLRFAGADLDRMASWVASFGDRAQVVSPRALRDAVVGRLRVVLEEAER